MYCGVMYHVCHVVMWCDVRNVMQACLRWWWSFADTGMHALLPQSTSMCSAVHSCPVLSSHLHQSPVQWSDPHAFATQVTPEGFPPYAAASPDVNLTLGTGVIRTLMLDMDQLVCV